jgi:hypothetical protein
MGAPTVDGFYQSAQVLARMALQAHAQRKPYVALFAGTSLEHLAKACLTSRSPVLIADLRAESSFPSLLLLSGGPVASSSPLRTVGLRGALDRVHRLVPRADPKNVRTLVDLRDGTVHAAENDEAETKIMTAFVKHSDALVTHLGRDRAAFWGDRVGVADALLERARDKVEHRVRVKLADAAANFRGIDEPVLAALRHIAETRPIDDQTEAHVTCCVCDSVAVLDGDRDVAYRMFADDDTELVVQEDPPLVVVFLPRSLACPVCGLKLDTPDDVEEAGYGNLIDEGPDRVNDFLSIGPDDDVAAYGPSDEDA